MRLWHIRITTTEGRDYMELDFPYKRHAYDFIWDWWLEDPTLLKVSLTDSADRAEPLTLNR